MTTCTHSCISEPLPWFVLEQLALGDLDEQEARKTMAHLASCPACSEVFEYISRDQVALPPLPTPLRKSVVEKRAPVEKTKVPWKVVAPVLAAAAALLLILNLPTGRDTTGTQIVSTKGGDLALSVVRRRGEAIRENPTRFEPGDQFRLLVTSPYQKNDQPVEVVIYQGDEAFFPYSEGLTVEAGNWKGIEGAFTLSGDQDALVCVVVGEPIPRREVLESTEPNDLPENSVCYSLKSTL